MSELLLNTFVVLFVVIDPIGLATTFAFLTHDDPAPFRREMAVRGVTLATIILLIFYFSGDTLLRALGITIPAFRIAGGTLLFLLALDMVFARHSGLRPPTSSEQAEAIAKRDISVFPLAFPLISGPGAITTVLLMAANATDPVTTLSMLAVMGGVMVLTLWFLFLAPRIHTLLGETGTNVVTRILGLVLAALAVQYLIDGIHAAFPG